MTAVTSSTDNTVPKKTNTDSKSGTKKANKHQSDLEALYDEFQKFWFECRCAVFVFAVCQPLTSIF